MRGRQRRQPRRRSCAATSSGPLHGVPIAMKDCFDFKPGWVTTFGGIRALKNYVAKTYCMFAERMEKAGAILVGKTNSPVFGFRGTCDNYLFGPSKNPFDLTKNTGGSSGGSAGAVAAGLLPLCEGTDGGGSIRIPSSWCGVFGYKPSFGRVPLVDADRMPSAALRRSSSRGRSPAPSRTPRWRWRCSPATIRATPTPSKATVDFMAALRELHCRQEDRLYARLWHLPGRSTRHRGRRQGGDGVRGSGRACRGGQDRHPPLAAGTERRLVPLHRAATGRGDRGLQARGHRSPRDHRDDLPPEFWHWDEIGRQA